jgi:hypothetical protein
MIIVRVCVIDVKVLLYLRLSVFVKLCWSSLYIFSVRTVVDRPHYSFLKSKDALGGSWIAKSGSPWCPH